ncbi:rhodanese-like domain-containing protein [Desulfoplanes sp.]
MGDENEQIVVKDIFPEELEGLIGARREGEYEIVDVRQPGEYQAGHIPGAVLIPLGEIEERLDEFGVDQDFLLYCRSGARSKAAANLLRGTGIGFKGIYNLVGGFGGYGGTGLVGLPRLDAVDMDASLDTIVVRAMDMEKGAFRFYSLFRERFPVARFISRLERLVDLEKKHAQALYVYWERHIRPKPSGSFEDLFASLGGDVLEGGETFDQWATRLDQAGGLACLDFAEAALVIENTAYDLYRHLTRMAGDPQAASFFRLLAEQEKGHVRVVSRFFEDCPGV